MVNAQARGISAPCIMLLYSYSDPVEIVCINASSSISESHARQYIVTVSSDIIIATIQLVYYVHLLLVLIPQSKFIQLYEAIANMHSYR